MLGLQKQLDLLDSQVKMLRQDFLSARRNSASTGLLTYVVSLQGMFATIGNPTAKAMYDYLTGLSASAHKRIQETTDPERVTQEIFTTIADHMKTLMAKSK